MYDHKTIPKGWFPAGHSPKAFDMGVHRTEHEPPAMFVRALPSPPGFGTVMQTFAAQRYLNQRIRFSAEVRATGVTEWAGLWMRVDDDKHESPSFDNMSDRPIVGTTD